MGPTLLTFSNYRQFILSLRDIFGSHKENLDNLSKIIEDISEEDKRSKEKWKNTSIESDSSEDLDKTEETNDIEKNESAEEIESFEIREAVNLLLSLIGSVLVRGCDQDSFLSA